MRLAFAVRISCALLLLVPTSAAFGWGADGHSIVAEIAQRRLGAAARAQVETLLGPGHSLAAEGSWADDVRAQRPETFNWHFVDIPIAQSTYDPVRQCAPTPKGDCIVAELERVKKQLACGDQSAKREALRWAVHLVADVHQPMHTVDEEQGANGIKVDVQITGLRCPRCAPKRTQENLHAVWDSSLISATTWDWGAYVTRLETGWLASDAARDAAGGSVVDWTLETHAVAQQVWPLLRADHVVDDAYYAAVLPLVDRQLARAGMRLARFLDEAFASSGGC